MKKILIVDDEPPLRFLFRDMFSDSQKFSVKEAGNARDAMKLFQEFKPDMLILDVALPDQDGRVILDDLKKDPHLEMCKVVLMSAIVDTEEAVLLSRAKVDLFLVKPFNIAEATQKVFTLLGSQ